MRPRLCTGSRRQGGGFSIPEVLVALLVLELGIVGTAGMIVLSGRVSARAAELERAAREVQEVADSLAHHGLGGAGERSRGGLRIRWAEEAGVLRIDVTAEGREPPILTVTAPAPPAGPGGEDGGEAPP